MLHETDQSFLHPQDIGVILSYRCQSACKHCLYNCGPTWQEWISPEDIRQVLQAVASLGDDVQIHITGGEPFLNFPLLLQAVEIAAELDIPRYVETNAGWCTHPDQVYDRFTILREAGLQAIMISCSPFHAETIPPHRTFAAIDIALQVFGSRRVMVYLPEWIDHMGRFDTHKPVPLERHIKAYGLEPAGLLLWDGYGLISGGRAGYQLGYLTDKHPASAFRFDDCYTDILYARHSHFDLYGNFISGFCGGLSIGTWRELERLLDEYAKGMYPTLISVLLEKGPYGLYELAVAHYGYQPLDGGYAGKCHLCVDVRRQLARSERFPELAPQQFYDIIP